MWDPTPTEVDAYLYALESYSNHQRFPQGFPREGSLSAQPELWLLAINVAESAIARASTETRDIAMLRRRAEEAD